MQHASPWRGPPRLFVLLMLLLAGCHTRQPPVYEDQHGFRFTPPPEWVERARDNAAPAISSHKQQNIPLPPFAARAKSGQERLLVLYHRLTVGSLAWLRVSVADMPAATPLSECLSAYVPGTGWKWEGDAETLEVNGQSAARVACRGRWSDQDYLNETVAIRRGEQVYFITASFPAADTGAREQIRQAIGAATWQP